MHSKLFSLLFDPGQPIKNMRSSRGTHVSSDITQIHALPVQEQLNSMICEWCETEIKDMI